jgi:IclR family KDG regulon transcriptional repressor
VREDLLYEDPGLSALTLLRSGCMVHDMDSKSSIRNFRSGSSAAKTLRLLEIATEADGPSLSKLIAATELPKSTVLRMLTTLVEEGFLERSIYGEYRPALKLWRLGCRSVDYETVRSEVLPVLRDLVAQTSETAHYAVYSDGEAVYVEKVDGTHPVRSYTSVGSSSPAYATATGKTLLAWQDDPEIRRVLERARRLTRSTNANFNSFLDERDKIRHCGYAVNRGEWRDGVWGIAAPVFDRGGQVVAAIGISGPESRISTEIDRLSNIVIKSARYLSERNGYATELTGARSVL